MSEETEVSINERLKFIIEKSGLSVRAFSTAVGVTDTNTRNYIDRGSKPNAEYLGKLLKRFNDINPTWLLLGEGEPFFPSTSENDLASTHNQKFFRSPIIGHNQGTANQQQHSNANAELDSIKNKLALAEKDVESLRTQLEMKDALLAAKDETINLLRASYNRPN